MKNHFWEGGNCLIPGRFSSAPFIYFSFILFLLLFPVLKQILVRLVQFLGPRTLPDKMK